LVAANAGLVHCFHHVSEELVRVLLAAPAHVSRDHCSHIHTHISCIFMFYRRINSNNNNRACLDHLTK